MAGCKRCALKGGGGGGRGKKKRKEKEKGGKMGIKMFFFVHAQVFSYAQWSFFKRIRKTVSRLRRSYLLLFAIKVLMVSQLGDL